jgi:hypothetical protein
VAEDERLLHASSFGVAATAYAEHRPDYAQAAVGWALEPAPGPRVLDLGAGTGKLTATLVALGAEVSAVEPRSGDADRAAPRPFLNPAGTEHDVQSVRKPTVGARNADSARLAGSSFRWMVDTDQPFLYGLAS